MLLPTVAIVGRPNVGKSRLLQTFALGSERVPLTGNSHRGSQTISYQPLVQALRVLGAYLERRRVRTGGEAPQRLVH